MTQTPTDTQIKILSPTIHFYHYMLRKGINESLDDTEERRQEFEQNLSQIAAHLTTREGENAAEFLRLIDLKEESHNRTIFDLTSFPDGCYRENSDRLYLENDTIKSRLVARLLNDTYFLSLIRYIPSAQHEQSLDSFAEISNYLDTPNIGLGKTAILAGVLQTPSSSEESRKSAAIKCLGKYLSQTSELEIEAQISQEYKFIGSYFYVLSRESIAEKFTENYQLKTKNLACVFFYEDGNAEAKADRIYNIFQNLLLSYHKINYFYFQSRSIKIKLQQLYQAIEQETENYQKQKWNTNSLIKLPQESLEYYRILSSLQDQVRLIGIQQYNYEESIRQIEQYTQETIPEFFSDFQQDIVFYLKQMKADISFLSPAIQLYERLMLSVQTQVSINEAEIQDNQAKLGQILTVAGTTIAFAQIAQEPITTTISQHIDQDSSLQSPSLLSLWISAGVTILISIVIGYLISLIFYKLFAEK